MTTASTTIVGRTRNSPLRPWPAFRPPRLRLLGGVLGRVTVATVVLMRGLLAQTSHPGTVHDACPAGVWRRWWGRARPGPTTCDLDQPPLVADAMAACMSLMAWSTVLSAWMAVVTAW